MLVERFSGKECAALFWLLAVALRAFYLALELPPVVARV